MDDWINRRMWDGGCLLIGGQGEPAPMSSFSYGGCNVEATVMGDLFLHKGRINSPQNVRVPIFPVSLLNHLLSRIRISHNPSTSSTRTAVEVINSSLINHAMPTVSSSWFSCFGYLVFRIVRVCRFHLPT
jgi:hypothetical protein